MHVLVDALGNPLKFRLTSGAAGDNPQTIPLLEGIAADEVLADRGDDADRTVAYFEDEMYAQAEPTGAARLRLRAYKERRLVECLIGNAGRPPAAPSVLLGVLLGRGQAVLAEAVVPPGAEAPPAMAEGGE